jgi:hypothetical protein
MLAYNQFFDQSELASPNLFAYPYMARMERELANHEASHIAGAFELYLESSNWVWGAYMDSSDEDKALWREDREFLQILDLTPEKVEEMGMNALKEMVDEEMKKGMDEKEGNGPPKLMVKFANF